MSQLRARIEEKIQARHLLSHPFYQRWQAGQLMREELQGYAKEYFSFESEFPRFLSALHAKCPDNQMRQQLLENLVHEEQGEDNHPELWLRFAEGMGVSRESVKEHFRSDETEHLMRTYRDLVGREGIAQGVAALYAYERQQPDVARTKMDGLKSFYGVNDEATVAFFKAHQHYDVFHAEAEIGILEKLCETKEDEDRVVAAVETSLDALYDFLDGVERRYRPLAA